MESKYKHLFSPILVNQTMLPNRIMAAPILRHISREKATSGIGTIIWGSGFIDDEYAPIRSGGYVFDPYAIQDSVRQKLDMYKQGGAKVSIELMHCGARGRFCYKDYKDPFGPSEYVRPDGSVAHPMNEEEMNRIADKFAEAAVTAKQLGFDMVMIHCAHGWLIHQFLSPKYNHRTDEYGGSIENRCRFPLMVLKRVREAVGKNFPIDIRVNGHDYLDVNMSDEDVIYWCRAASQYVDMINVSAGNDLDKPGTNHCFPMTVFEHCKNIQYSKMIKDAVDIPVAVVGAIETPEEAEQIIAEGYADIVTIGRALIADPLWVKKAYENKAEEITPCLRCNMCQRATTNRMDESCSVNPRFNKEDQYPLHPVKEDRKEKVVIIGGGPAGMEAALTLKDRGFEDVTILEKTDHLGGQLVYSDYESFKSDLRRYKDYMIRKVLRSDIRIIYNCEADPEMVKEMQPDIILACVGASPLDLKIEGREKPNVFNALDIYPDLKRLSGKVTIIGGGMVGSEMALGLSDIAEEVNIVDLSPKKFAGINMPYAGALEVKYEEKGNIRYITSAKAEAIYDKEIVYMDLEDGKRKELESDYVIIAIGTRSNRELANSFYGICQKTYILGDCNRLYNVKGAVNDAYYLCMSL